MEELKRIEKTALTRAKKARTSQDVAVLRAEILGKKGALGTGTRRVSHLRDNLQAGVGRLPDAAMRRRMIEYLGSL
jgi:hypothetical protein